MRLAHLDGAALADATAHKQPAGQPGVLWVAAPQITPFFVEIILASLSIFQPFNDPLP